jgi:hypothetical protein
MYDVCNLVRFMMGILICWFELPSSALCSADAVYSMFVADSIFRAYAYTYMQGVSPVLVDAMAAAVDGIESFTKISDVTTEQFTALFTGITTSPSMR